jgi:hypothetical protein
MRQATVCWSFLVEWGDGSCQWIDLKVLKESNPAQVGERYVIARGLRLNAVLPPNHKTQPLRAKRGHMYR